MGLNSNKELVYTSKDLFKDNQIDIECNLTNGVVFYSDGLIGVVDVQCQLYIFNRDSKLAKIN